MRGGYDVLSQALQRADEIKHPVGRVRDIEALDELLETLSDDKPRIIALQPISQKEDATRLCIDTCIARNWRLSMQTHKYLNIALNISPVGHRHPAYWLCVRPALNGVNVLQIAVDDLIRLLQNDIGILG